MGSKETKLYMHKEAREFAGYRLQIKAMARRKTSNPNVYRVLTTKPEDLKKILDEAEVETANAELFDMVVQTCGDSQLLDTLGQRYDDDGYGAMQYIASCWGTGNAGLMDKAWDRYRELHTKGLQASMTSAEVSAVFTEMSSVAATLKGTTRALTLEQQVHNMIDMFKEVSTDHAVFVRTAKDGELPEKDPVKVAATLEGFVCQIKPKPTETASKQAALRALLADLGLEEHDLTAFVAQTRQKKNAARELSRCQKCGVKHSGECYAQMLVDGKQPRALTECRRSRRRGSKNARRRSGRRGPTATVRRRDPLWERRRRHSVRIARRSPASTCCTLILRRARAPPSTSSPTGTYFMQCADFRNRYKCTESRATRRLRT